MPAASVNKVTMNHKGQITLSNETIKKLGLLKGDTFKEKLIGKCLLLVPERLAKKYPRVTKSKVKPNLKRRQHLKKLTEMSKEAGLYDR